MLLKCCTQYASKFGKLSSGHRTGEDQIFFFPIPNTGNTKNVQTTIQTHASKVMLKILQARLQQYMNQEGPDKQAGFRNDRGTRDQVANIYWMLKKNENSR